MSFKISHPNLFDSRVFYLEAPDGTPQDNISNQVKEILEWEVYKPPKKKNRVIVDIGANIGMASLYLRQFGEYIYAIEPNPFNYACLVKNTGWIDNVNCFNVGVGNNTGTRDLLSISDGMPENYFFAFKGHTVTKTIPTYCTRLDYFFTENKISHVDLLKIDVEGSEYEIFLDESFANVCDSIDTIVGESHINGEEGLWPPFITAVLEKRGYKVKYRDTPEANYKFVYNYKRVDSGYQNDVTLNMKTNFIAKRV